MTPECDLFAQSDEDESLIRREPVPNVVEEPPAPGVTMDLPLPARADSIEGAEKALRLCGPSKAFQGRQTSAEGTNVPGLLDEVGIGTAAYDDAELPDPTAADGEEADEVEMEKVDDTDSVVSYAVAQAHAKLFECDPYPSAKKCGTCHPKHYREWSVSPHAYAQLSPVFNAMSSTLQHVTNGTNADFCIRCHTPVGMALNEPMQMSNLNRHPTSREGVTCVVCHRINKSWGKGSGRQALVAGDTNQVVYGPLGSSVLNAVLADPDKYGVLKPVKAPDVKGRDVHRKVVKFWNLSAPGFCGSCHDVFAPNGFRLEDAFSEYKQSPAARKLHQTCQDCHMGKVPGEAKGYSCEPIAVLGDTSTPPRRRTNHMMAGPDYSIIHPGLFPHHMHAIREEHEPESPNGLATMREWLEFDDAAGWGTDEFEKKDPSESMFPFAWRDRDRRIRARRILDDQHQLLAESAYERLHVLRVGYRMGEIKVTKCDKKGIQFQVPLYNGTLGHSVPTGFDAERLVFLRVMVRDRNGRLVYQSGDLDPNGDVRDSHSLYVHNGKLPVDTELVSLQSRFVIRLQRGGEREQVLVFPYSLTPLPFVRPATRPFTVLGRPLVARKHKQNIEVGGKRVGTYNIPRKNLTGCGPYTVNAQVIAGMVPVNLIERISIAGFDYGMSAADVARNVVAGHLVLHERTKTIKTR